MIFSWIAGWMLLLKVSFGSQIDPEDVRLIMAKTLVIDRINTAARRLGSHGVRSLGLRLGIASWEYLHEDAEKDVKALGDISMFVENEEIFHANELNQDWYSEWVDLGYSHLPAWEPRFFKLIDSIGLAPLDSIDIDPFSKRKIWQYLESGLLMALPSETDKNDARIRLRSRTATAVLAQVISGLLESETLSSSDFESIIFHVLGEEIFSLWKKIEPFVENPQMKQYLDLERFVVKRIFRMEFDVNVSD